MDAEARPCPGTAALLPTPSAPCGGLLFGSNPAPMFLQEQIYKQSFPLYLLPPPFSGFPAIAVTTRTEMQVIRLNTSKLCLVSWIRKLI